MRTRIVIDESNVVGGGGRTRWRGPSRTEWHLVLGKKRNSFFSLSPLIGSDPLFRCLRKGGKIYGCACFGFRRRENMVEREIREKIWNRRIRKENFGTWLPAPDLVVYSC
jgi:hypothetical protein